MATVLPTPTWVNNFGTTLAAGLTSSATTCTLTNVATLPTLPANASGATGFPLIMAMTLISATNNAVFEIVNVTGVSGNTATIVRGVEGTSPLAFNAGDLANCLITAGALRALAALNGNPNQIFNALPATATTNVVVLGQFTNSGSGTVNTFQEVLPDGVCDQTFVAIVTATNGIFSTNVTMPHAFPHGTLDAICSYGGNTPPPNVGIAVQPLNNTQVQVTTNGLGLGAPGTVGIVIRARGA